MSTEPAPKDGTPGPPKQFDHEAMFLWWYNDGERRTYAKVCEQFECSYATVKRYADEYDWEGRADEIDAITVAQINKQLASTRARRVVRTVRILDAVETKFLQRLQLPDSDPAALTPGQVQIEHVARIGELRDKLLGGVTHRFGTEDGGDSMSLAEIDKEIERLNMRELEAGKEGGADG